MWPKQNSQYWVGLACASLVALVSQADAATLQKQPPLSDTAYFTDSNGLFLSVMPPGNNGNSAGGAGLPIQGTKTKYPANFIDQETLYQDLSYAQAGLQTTPCTPPADLNAHQAASQLACNYFKHEGLTPDTVVSTETATAKVNGVAGGTVTIKRDGWGVPYVTAANRSDAMYGIGRAQAEDRLWLLDVLRNVGRGQLSKFLGPASFFYEVDAGLAVTAGYSEEEMTEMVNDSATKFGSLGTLMLADMDAYVAGINDYIDALRTTSPNKIPPEYLVLKQGGFPPPHFTRNDVVSSAIFIQSLFAVGGGSENVNELMLQHLDPSITAGITQLPAAACEFWRDMRHADDPQASRTIATEFHQSPAQLDESCPQTLPAGAAIWDVGSYQVFAAYSVDGVSQNQIVKPKGSAPGLSVIAAQEQGASFAKNLAKIHQWALNREQRQPMQLALAQPSPLGPFDQLKQSFRDSGFSLPNSFSNWMAVNASHTQSGHPIGVMGPQMSYFDPELTWEVAVQSTGGTPLDFAGRGMLFGSLPYILIGRGLNYAWSATSGDSDLIDTRVSKLCNTNGKLATLADRNRDGFPDSDGYLFDAMDGQGPQCRKFYERTDGWLAKPTLASVGSLGPLVPQHIQRHVMRTHYGPVFAFATVNGAPVAISVQRSTFFGELDTAAPFALSGTASINSAQQFEQLFNGVTGTFNWLYVDSHDVGYMHSGLFPIRNAGQSLDLPVWGDGRFEWASDAQLPPGFFKKYGGKVPFPDRATPVVVNGGPLAGGYVEWQNFLPYSQHPQALNPSQGYILSWNNSPAPGWWAADNHANWAAIHRIDTEVPRFDAFMATGQKFNFANVVEIMGDAGYTDFRGQELLPLLLKLMQQGNLTDTQQQVVTRMQQWLDQGSLQWIDAASGGQPGLGAWRRDRDGDGIYDNRSQVVLMDAWYLRLMETVTTQLVAADTQADVMGLTSCQSLILICHQDAPRQQGSAYEYGWYQVMVRMLQMTLNTPGHTDYRTLKCAGTGALNDCRNAVLTALDEAISDLGGWSQYGSWDGSTLWNMAGNTGAPVEQYDQIIFADFSLLSDPAMIWSNRPTFQQVVEVSGANQ